MRETRTLEFKENMNSNSFLKTISAFANYSNGEIIFGICDDGTIKGIDNPIDACLNLENKINDSIKPIPSYTLDITKENTIILKVFEGTFKPYLYKGKAYKRNDSSTIEVDRLELNRLVLEGLNQSYEEQESTQQDLTFHILEDELSKKLEVEHINTDILRTLGLIKNGKFNNAAALIADSNQFKGVDVIRFGKDINEIMDREILDHISILEMYRRVLNMYKKYFLYMFKTRRYISKIEGSLRISKEKIPEEAFREALANSLVHRLWDINARIRISMFEDKIEITSCGGLPREISEKEYLDGQISFLRNPIIGNIFFRLNYIEMFGSGIKRINASYNNFQNKPEFKIYENSITVILPIESNLISLSEDEKAIVSILKNNLKLSRTQIEDETQFTKYKTIRILNSLIEKNVVQKIGNAQSTKYILK